MEKTKKGISRNGLLALSPLVFMALLFVGLSFCCGGFHKVPLLIVFLLTSAYALFTLRGFEFDKRIMEFSRGAGNTNLLQMVWIFVLAGAFASSAKAMGAVDATVALTMNIMPARMLLCGLFLASCFISISIGTSVGTVVALVPIASGLSESAGLDLPLIVAAVVGGSFFGDNLSFISDTTVVATRTQGCRMSDKFRTNFRIVLPAAIISFLIYLYWGWNVHATVPTESVNYLKVLPYPMVLIAAIMGYNVMLVLAVGLLLTAIVGLSIGGFSFLEFLQAVCNGIEGMSELIIISMLAGGLLSVIRRGGGITWLMRTLTRRVHTRRTAELSIVLLTALTNLCTANNTVAILSVGSLARDIAIRFGVDPRKSASLLDTSSCCIQGIIPYGAQLLMAGGLANIASTEIIPYLFYPMLLGIAVLLAIFFNYPRLTKPMAQ